jgi:3-phosphoshikimate 1-carboxyvinyltransferase
VRVIVRAARRLSGRVEVPGDKSVSHRAAILGALASGPTDIANYLEGEDCLRTLQILEALGVPVTRKGPGRYLISGGGIDGLQEPDHVLDAGNSGTAARLLIGVLAGQPFWSMLTGDDSLRRRPMGRVTEPLRQMGATIVGRQEGSRLPLAIRGARPLRELTAKLPVASAQVKSALLLAGLYADGPVTVEEPARSRDHTERMLAEFGALTSVDGTRITLVPGGKLCGRPIRVPGDFSSAAFFLAAASLIPDSEVTVEGVGVNPTRTGLLDALEAMGAVIARSSPEGAGEPVASLTARSSPLRGVSVGGELIPRIIDEIPILAVAASLAEGVTEVKDALELRIKESDRIRALVTELGKLGAEIEERDDGFRVRGRTHLRGAKVQSWGDHRMAMALIIAGLAAEGETVVEDADCIATSYPGFLATLQGLAGNACVEAEP